MARQPAHTLWRRLWRKSDSCGHSCPSRGSAIHAVRLSVPCRATPSRPAKMRPAPAPARPYIRTHPRARRRRTLRACVRAPPACGRRRKHAQALAGARECLRVCFEANTQALARARECLSVFASSPACRRRAYARAERAAPARARVGADVGARWCGRWSHLCGARRCGSAGYAEPHRVNCRATAWAAVATAVRLAPQSAPQRVRRLPGHGSDNVRLSRGCAT